MQNNSKTIPRDTLLNIKKEFPIFSRAIHGQSLVYLDNASTTQKPRAVIDAIVRYYETMNANIHRGIHLLSEESTEAFEQARSRVAAFINAKSSQEIVFTKSCTESINMVAHSWGRQHIKAGDEIIVSAYEHHANLIPWQELAKEKQARLSVIPLNDDLTLDMSAYERMLSSKTKLVCITAQSNVLGIIPNLKAIISLAHDVGAKVLVDGAQQVGHSQTNVQKLKADFFAFSSHKMCGPTGVGVLYAPIDLLSTFTPYQYGGDMVTTVDSLSALYREVPWRLEAGTPNIADVIALPAAVDFIESIGFDAIRQHEDTLLAMTRERFMQYSEVTLFPKNSVNTSILSFTVCGVHPHDIATIFNACGIAIRSGLHCAEPLIRRMGVEGGLARMSFYFYNDSSDIDRAEEALKRVFSVFQQNTKH